MADADRLRSDLQKTFTSTFLELLAHTPLAWTLSTFAPLPKFSVLVAVLCCASRRLSLHTINNLNSCCCHYHRSLFAIFARYLPWTHAWATLVSPRLWTLAYLLCLHDITAYLSI